MENPLVLFLHNTFLTRSYSANGLGKHIILCLFVVFWAISDELVS